MKQQARERRLAAKQKQYKEMERPPQSDIFRKHGYEGLHKPGSVKKP